MRDHLHIRKEEKMLHIYWYDLLALRLTLQDCHDLDWRMTPSTAARVSIPL